MPLDRRESVAAIAASNSAVRLVLTDSPDDWCTLVEQIADLEEMLNEAATSGDHDALVGLDELQQLVDDRRLRLRRIDAE